MSRGHSETEPLLSIGMPVYNAERTIRRAVDSLLAQDIQDLELVISDNASTDSTSEICERYAAIDPRVRYTRRERNHGQLPNYDYSLSLARGRYFMWASDDDSWGPRFASTLVGELERDSGIGAAMCAIERVTESGASLDVVRFGGPDDRAWRSNLALLMAMATGFASKRPLHLMLYGVYRTALLRSARPYAAAQVPHPDRVFMCQLALGLRFRYVDQPLYVRTVRDVPGHIRLPDERFNRLINADPWAYTKTVLSLGPYLLRSGIVPWYRKAYIPIAVLAMAWSYQRVLYSGRLPLALRVPLTMGRRAKRLFR